MPDFLHLSACLESMVVSPDHVFVEIGTDRGEGSTRHLDAYAASYGVTLHTVDIDASMPDRILDQTAIAQLSHTVCHVADGTSWAKNYGNTIACPIDLLFLDNFDYIEHRLVNDTHHDWLANKSLDYETFGLHLDNQQCQLAHFSQLWALLPWLAPHCVVFLDDTYLWNDCWVGKSGPGVLLLLAHGFSIYRKGYNEVTMVRQ